MERRIALTRPDVIGPVIVKMEAPRNMPDRTNRRDFLTHAAYLGSAAAALSLAAGGSAIAQDGKTAKRKSIFRIPSPLRPNGCSRIGTGG